MNKIINVCLLMWLILLTLFVVYDTIYDRKMQRLDMKSDEVSIKFHETVIKQFEYVEKEINNLRSG